MYFKAYHNALNQGFSEREAERIGEDAYEDAQFMSRKHQEHAHAEQQEQEYFEEMERKQNTITPIDFPLAYLYRFTKTGYTIVTINKQTCAESGSGLWIEIPLFKRDV